MVCETVRETDGLALSSSNVYLNGAERAIAPKLYGTLNTVAVGVRAGQDVGVATARGFFASGGGPARRIDNLSLPAAQHGAA